jgi:glycosyltransferase involved in cell wall biosynthesis
MNSRSTNPAIYYWPSIRPTHWQDALFLAKIIKQYKPVMVMANFAAENICLLISFFLGVPLRFARYHTTFDQDWMAPKRNKIKIVALVLRKALVYKFATMLLPVSEAMSFELERIYKVPRTKIKYFHNALKDQEIQKPEVDPLLIELMCVGRLTFGKGQDILIRALSTVVKKYRSVKLLLVGSGEYKSELMALVDHLELNEAVEFIGQVSHKTALSLMAGAYAVVVPSRFEAFSYVTIEAMSVGTLVIASAVGGISELIRDTVDGFLVPPENPVILANKIIDLLDNSDLHCTMQKNVRDRFLMNFEMKQAIKKEANWLEEIMSMKLVG